MSLLPYSKIALLFAALICFSKSFAQDFTASGDQNWNDAWSPGLPSDGTPGNENILVIPAGAKVTIPAYQYIVLTDVVLVIQDGGELVVADGSLTGLSTLDINSSDGGGGSGIVVQEGGTISDGSTFGYFNSIEVDGEDFWGGGGYLGTAEYEGSETFTETDSQPQSLANDPEMAELLPVELVTFTAKSENDLVTLAWQTASELNNDGFEVQLSVNGEHFEAIGFVKGHGTSTTAQHYTFDHYSSVSAYYRLKQMDYDGKFDYSPIRYVNQELTKSMKVSIFPNPTFGEINIDGPVTNYVLYDQSGKIMLSDKNTTSFQAQAEISEYLTSQHSGRYILSTILNGKKLTNIIIKK